MKPLLVLACSGLLAFTGCMREYDLTRDVRTARRNEVNERLLAETWAIENLDGTSAQGRITAVTPDSMTYVEESSGRLNTIPTCYLATVSSSPGFGGPILGLLGGGIIGGALGLVVGGSQPTSHDLGGAIVGTAQTAYGGALGVLIGAPLGLLVGSQISAGETYVFNRPGSGRGDTAIVINREDLTGETGSSVTFRWAGKGQIVPKIVAVIQKEEKTVRITLPREYLRR